MGEHPFSISFGIPTGGPEYSYLLIEQEPWGTDVGKTTIPQALAGMMSAIYGTAWPLINCGGDSSGYDTAIYVYPYPNFLSYQFFINNGEFIPSISKFDKREEMVQCGFSDSVELDYPPLYGSRPSLQWIGQCFDSTGALTSYPNIEVNGRTLRFSKKVYGSIRAVYFVYRRVYRIRVEERDEAIENNFDSMVYCVWSELGGGVRWKKVDPPSGYDYSQGSCGNGFPPGGGGNVIINPPDDGEGDKRPVADEVDKEIVKDYCTQEVTSNNLDPNE